MNRIFLTLTSLVAPVAFAACASQPAATPAPAPAPMPPAFVGDAPAQPTTAPVLASAGSAAPSAAPAAAAMNSDDLPSGHPDIAQLLEQRKQAKGKATMNGELPAGHPPISGMTPRAGTPMQAMQPGTTQPAMFGTLIVRAVQGTSGGPAIGELPVVVELLMGDQVVDKKQLKLGSDGTLRLDSIPLSMNVTPVVKVTYNGVEFSGQGGVMDASRAEQQVQVPVFETTETAPAWAIKMQHVMLEPTVDGVRVIEMLAVENPTDRAWVGQAAGADGKRRTLAFALPAGAKDVTLGGALHDCCTVIEGGKVFDSMALVPGVSQYRIGYTLPVEKGKADVAFATVAPVKHLMVFVPDDGSTVNAEGIGNAGVADMGGGKTRFYRATDVAAGTAVKLSISNITARAAAAATADAAGTPGGPRTASPKAKSSSAQTAKLIAGAGGLTIFVVGGMLLMFKAPKSKKA
jgi:hypothetical protein